MQCGPAAVGGENDAIRGTTGVAQTLAAASGGEVLQLTMATQSPRANSSFLVLYLDINTLHLREIHISDRWGDP